MRSGPLGGCSSALGGMNAWSLYLQSDMAYPESWGAKGDGVTDDTAAIQAAATSLALTGGTLVFAPDKLYRISAAITLPKGVVAEGNARPLKMSASPATIAGCGSGLITLQSSNVAFFVLSDGCAVRRVNLGLVAGTATPTGGKAIDMSGAYGCELTGVTVNGVFDGIYSVNASITPQHLRLRDVNVLRIANRGVVFSNVVDFAWDTGVIMNWGVGWTQTGKGVHLLNNCATGYFHKVLHQSLAEGIRVIGYTETLPATPTTSAQDLHWTDCIVDAPRDVAVACKGLRHSSFVGCNVFSSAGYGFWIDDYCVGVQIIGGCSEGGTNDGITIQGVQDTTTISGVTIMGRHFASLNGFGICVAADTSHFIISNNRFSRTSPLIAGQSAMPYSICVVPGNSNHYVIVDNLGAGATGIISDGGTGLDKSVQGLVP
jgi:hypothetical protein